LQIRPRLANLLVADGLLANGGATWLSLQTCWPRGWGDLGGVAHLKTPERPTLSWFFSLFLHAEQLFLTQSLLTAFSMLMVLMS
jgi:hypothetical protein